MMMIYSGLELIIWKQEFLQSCELFISLYCPSSHQVEYVDTLAEVDQLRIAKNRLWVKVDLGWDCLREAGVGQETEKPFH